MKININNLKDEVNAFNRLLNKYEESYLNYNNMISSFSFYWRDYNSQRFFDAVKQQRISYESVLNDLKDIRNIYNYMIDKYSAFGRKVYANLESKNKVIKYFDSYINNIDSIINRFYSLDLSFCPNEAYYIRNVRDRLITQREKLKDCRQKVKNYYTKINNIELEIRRKISKLSVSNVKTMDITGMF